MLSLQLSLSDIFLIIIFNPLFLSSSDSFFFRSYLTSSGIRWICSGRRLLSTGFKWQLKL